MIKTYTVRILDSGFTGLAELDDYRSLEFTRRWQKANGLTLNVSQYSPAIAYLVDGNYVEVRKNRAPLARLLLSEEGISLTEEGKLSELWEMLGIDVITRRVCGIMPFDPNADGEQHYAGPGETIMRYLVDQNVIDPADANRTIPDITLEPDLARGTVLDDVVARYSPLVDKLEEVCRASTLGWELTPLTDGLSFHVIEGVDRTIHQALVPPVVFSPDRGNIRVLGYRCSKVGRVNLAYVGGSGQGGARTIETAYLDVADPTGADRIETWLNASDVVGVLSINDRARAELDAQAPLERLEAEILVPDGLGDNRAPAIIIEDTVAEFAAGTLTRTYADPTGDSSGDLALHPASLWTIFHARSLWGIMEAA